MILSRPPGAFASGGCFFGGRKGDAEKPAKLPQNAYRERPNFPCLTKKD